MTFAILALVALFFLGMGILGLAAPDTLIKPFGIELRHSLARTEVRAVYGGFGVAISVVLTLPALDVGGLRTGVATAVAAALLGMAFGRLVSAVVDRPVRFYPSWFYFLVETIGGTALLLA
ncbi:hypothetical protein [Alloactinosynnema sp. L-07]|uniref:DUF4345 family protein n=1 Tax=Alloactinosynnema sp. L-07 TaxID=1653480 RepID=UPI00065F08E7|nr:DUF4345 family protein [Alloactinosynnema sp. L-07]CRK56293.1 hypothetical protein [Alloactinosynnema sp. L-07]